MRIAVVVAVLVAGGLARGEGSNLALEFLERGTAQFRAGELAAARESFLRARDLVPEKANPYRWLGLVEARLNHCREAVEALDQFLARVPPDDVRIAEAVTVRDRCKDELAPKIGHLVLDSRPEGAEVRLDDERTAAVGTTPYDNPAIAAGPHVLFVRKAGFRGSSRGISIARGETVRVELALEPESAAAPVAVAAKLADQPPAPKRKSRAWIAGVVVGVVAAVALGVGLGVGLGLASSGNGETALPAIKGGP